MNSSMHHCIYLAYASTAKKKKGSKELKDLEKRLNQSILPAQHSLQQLLLAREGVQGQPLGHELLGAALTNEQISILHLISEPADLEGIYLNSVGGKRQALNWDEIELSGLSDLSLVILDGGGSLDWAERLLFGGAPAVMALRYQQGESKAEVAQHFIQQFYQQLAHGHSIEEAYQAAILPEALFVPQHTVIPSDPYDYWDFREALEGKSQFPWGLYLLPNQESSLQKSFFTELSLPEVVEVEEPVVEETEAITEVVEPVESSPVEIAATLPEQTEVEETPVVEETEAITEVVEPVESSPVEIAATLPEQTEVEQTPVVEETEAITEVVEPVEASPVEIAATLPEQTEVVESPVVKETEAITEVVEPVEASPVEIAATLPELTEV
ncbi:MAG: hypothetical protein AAF399_02460, partial [Bacteroidota bacterium]